MSFYNKLLILFASRIDQELYLNSKVIHIIITNTIRTHRLFNIASIMPQHPIYIAHLIWYTYTYKIHFHLSNRATTPSRVAHDPHSCARRSAWRKSILLRVELLCNSSVTCSLDAVCLCNPFLHYSITHTHSGRAASWPHTSVLQSQTPPISPLLTHTR